MQSSIRRQVIVVILIAIFGLSACNGASSGLKTENSTDMGLVQEKKFEASPGKAIFSPTPFPSNAIIYTVQEGDTLDQIVRQTHVPAEIIMALNGIQRNTQLVVGQQLVVGMEPKLVPTAVAKQRLPGTPSSPPGIQLHLNQSLVSGRALFLLQKKGASYLYSADPRGDGQVRSIATISAKVFDVHVPPGRERIDFILGTRIDGSEVSHAQVFSLGFTKQQPEFLVSRSDALIDFAWSPNGRYLAYVARSYSYSAPDGWQDTLFILNTECLGSQDGCQGSEKAVGTTVRYFDGLVWSPKGDQLAFAGLPEKGSGDVYMVNADSNANGLLSASLFSSGGALSDTRWWPPDKLSPLSFCWKTDSVELCQNDGMNNKPETVYVFPEVPIEQDISRSGGQMVVTYASGSRTSWKMDLRKLDGSGSSHIAQGEIYLSPTFSPNEQYILFVKNHQSVIVYDIEDDTFRSLFGDSLAGPVDFNAAAYLAWIGWSP
jgi:murein DD-endopeptidase MepM/ murein hydrolase activator NlpD